MADCGAILNRSVFPECLWLIWHFSLNPSRRLCSLQLYLSLSAARSIFRWLFSVLIQGSHSLNIYHPAFLLILRTDVLCHHCPVSLNIPQVSFNQCELLSLLCAVNECIAFQAQGQKSLSVCVTPSFFVLILQNQSALHHFFVNALPGLVLFVSSWLNLECN